MDSPHLCMDLFLQKSMEKEKMEMPSLAAAGVAVPEPSSAQTGSA